MQRQVQKDLSYEYIEYIINTLYTNVTREESKKRRRKLGGGARFIEFHCIDLVEITLPAYKIPTSRRQVVNAKEGLWAEGKIVDGAAK